MNASENQVRSNWSYLGYDHESSHEERVLVYVFEWVQSNNSATAKMSSNNAFITRFSDVLVERFNLEQNPASFAVKLLGTFPVWIRLCPNFFKGSKKTEVGGKK